MPANAPKNLAPSGGRAQIRRRRVDRVAVVRGHRGGGPRREVTDPVAGCGVLRHPGTRSGAQQDHPAAPRRGRRRRLAPEIAVRTRCAAPRSTRRWTRPTRPPCQANCWMWCWRSFATARSSRSHESPPDANQVLYGAEGAALAEFSNDQVTAWSAGPRGDSGIGSRRTTVARVGTGAHRRNRQRAPDTRAVEPAEQSAARRRCGTRRSRLQAGACARRDGTAQRSRSRPATRCTARWPNKSSSCWCGIAPCAPTPTTPCTRCG